MSRQRKTQQLQIRVTPEQKSRIRQAARRSGRGMSAWILGRLLPPVADEFRSLVSELSRARHRRPVLAAINDFLCSLRPGEYEDAVADIPRSGLPPVVANQLAAMVEQAAGDLGRRPPDWTRQVEPLPEPWFATQIESLRLHLLVVSPPVFRRRNLFVDATLGDRI